MMVVMERAVDGRRAAADNDDPGEPSRPIDRSIDRPRKAEECFGNRARERSFVLCRVHQITTHLVVG